MKYCVYFFIILKYTNKAWYKGCSLTDMDGQIGPALVIAISHQKQELSFLLMSV